MKRAHCEVAAMPEKNQMATVTITGITSEGNGVGTIDGFTVFVPLTAIGDIAKVKVVKLHKTYCYGRLEELLQMSPDRMTTDCAVFSQCGGCAYRHITYDAELALKEQLVRDAFERLGKIHAPHLPIIGSKRVNGYRNKAQYPVGTDREGRLSAGFYANRSHRIIPCQECQLQQPGFERLKQAVLSYAEANSVTAYDEAKHSGILRHICIRHAEQTGEWMVMLVCTRKKLPNPEQLVGLLLEAEPAVSSVVLNYNPKNTNVILGNHCQTIWGKPELVDILCGKTIALSPLSFYQVNHDQAEVLYGAAKSFANLTGGETLVDLYCGAGTVGLSMADQVRQLIGIEVIPQAVENAAENARRNRIEHAEFICADAAEATKQLRSRGITPDVVVVDPPRKGCDASVLEDIAAMGPKRIVMISCNPATAARDCAHLGGLGYQTEKVQAVDMFPRTVHVETVVLLVRKDI